MATPNGPAPFHALLDELGADPLANRRGSEWNELVRRIEDPANGLSEEERSGLLFTLFAVLEGAASPTTAAAELRRRRPWCDAALAGFRRWLEVRRPYRSFGRARIYPGSVSPPMGASTSPV